MNKNPDELSQQEKIKLGIETIKIFFDSLGPNDIYKKILLEELMKYLMHGSFEVTEDE